VILAYDASGSALRCGLETTVLGSKEPTLLCNHLKIHMDGLRVYQDNDAYVTVGCLARRGYASENRWHS
jgi:hypothetical protein